MLSTVPNSEMKNKERIKFKLSKNKMQRDTRQDKTRQSKMQKQTNSGNGICYTDTDIMQLLSVFSLSN